MEIVARGKQTHDLFLFLVIKYFAEKALCIRNTVSLKNAIVLTSLIVFRELCLYSYTLCTHATFPDFAM